MSNKIFQLLFSVSLSYSVFMQSMNFEPEKEREFEIQYKDKNISLEPLRPYLSTSYKEYKDLQAGNAILGEICETLLKSSRVFRVNREWFRLEYQTFRHSEGLLNKFFTDRGIDLTAIHSDFHLNYSLYVEKASEIYESEQDQKIIDDFFIIIANPSAIFMIGTDLFLINIDLNYGDAINHSKISEDMFIELGLIFQETFKMKTGKTIRYRGGEKSQVLYSCLVRGVTYVKNSRKILNNYDNIDDLRPYLTLPDQVRNIGQQVRRCRHNRYYCIEIDQKKIREGSLEGIRNYFQEFDIRLYVVTNLELLKNKIVLGADDRTIQLKNIFLEKTIKGIRKIKVNQIQDDTLVIDISHALETGHDFLRDDESKSLIAIGKEIRKLCAEEIFDRKYKIKFCNDNQKDKFPITQEQLNEINADELLKENKNIKIDEKKNQLKNYLFLQSAIIGGGFICLVIMLLYYRFQGTKGWIDEKNF